MGAVRKGESRRSWFLHFLWRSIAQRKGRVAVASLSVMMASAIVVCALGLSLGIRQKLGGELKAYGANVIVSPREGYLKEDLLQALSGAGGVEGVEAHAGQLYAPLRARQAEVELIGLDMADLRNQDWKITGSWPAAGEVMLGADLAEALATGPGQTLALGYGDSAAREFKVAGTVQRGGPEDTSVLMDISDAWELTGLRGSYSSVLLRVRPDTISTTVASLRSALGGAAEVKTVRQVAFAEESFLGKIELLMGLVTIVVLLAANISVMSTMSATVLERLREIGLMKAIGGTKVGIGVFYISEGLFIGLVGGLSGYAVGVASAEAVSRGAFGSFISVPLQMLPVSIALGVTVAVASSLLPLLEALRRPASVMLREE